MADYRDQTPTGPTDLTSLRPETNGTPLPEDAPAVVPEAVKTPSSRHVEAGRKGAHRIHQLIEEGRVYEQERGLKRGRQRLRQLIQMGKLYEQEHGLRRQERPRRVSDEEAFRTFLQALLRVVKPALRDRLARLCTALEAEAN
jgi:hypothetical protein